MRYCEMAIAGLMDGRQAYLSTSIGADYNEVSGKLLYDVGAFLVSSARLSPSFRTAIREIALNSPNDITSIRIADKRPTDGLSARATPPQLHLPDLTFGDGESPKDGGA
jgi:hypothetical protein